MTWWFYLVAIPAALFLVNGVPHFTQGVAGKRFPSPFTGGPPNLDTPTNNVIWGGANLIIGGVLLAVIRDGLSDWTLLLELVVFGLIGAIALSRVFGRLDG